LFCFRMSIFKSDPQPDTGIRKPPGCVPLKAYRTGGNLNS
jgi:hypothetical protein